MSLRNRLVVDARFGAFATAEQTLARLLWSSVPDMSLTILDRGFIDYEVFADLVTTGHERHVMVRLRSNAKFTEIGQLPDGTLLVELRPHYRLRKRRPDIAPVIRGRVVAYKHPGGKPGRLFVTLIDSKAYPAAELVELYHERWELEVGLDEIKTHMLERKESLRSKTPAGVAQELWGLFLTYELVRREMLLAARDHDLPPQRISFRSSILHIRTAWLVAWRTTSKGNIPKHLGQLRSTLDVLILPVRRSERRYPRHVKIKMSNYKRNRGKRGPAADETTPPGPTPAAGATPSASPSAAG